VCIGPYVATAISHFLNDIIRQQMAQLKEKEKINVESFGKWSSYFNLRKFAGKFQNICRQSNKEESLVSSHFLQFFL